MSMGRVIGVGVVCVLWAIAASSAYAVDQLGVDADEASAANSQSEPAAELGQAGSGSLSDSVAATGATPSGRLSLMPTASELARYYGANPALTGRLALGINTTRLTLNGESAVSALDDGSALNAWGNEISQYELLFPQQVGLAMATGAGVGLLNFAIRDLTQQGLACNHRVLCYPGAPLLGALNGGILVSAPLLVETLVLAPNVARFNKTAIHAAGIAAGALGGFLISSGYWNNQTGDDAFPKFGFPSRDDEVANSLAMSGAVVASTATVTALIYIIRSRD